MELCDRAPGIGAVQRYAGRVIVVESHGKRWRADASLSFIGGPVGVEGQWVCYVYFRLARLVQLRVQYGRPSHESGGGSCLSDHMEARRKLTGNAGPQPRGCREYLSLAADGRMLT